MIRSTMQRRIKQITVCGFDKIHPIHQARNHTTQENKCCFCLEWLIHTRNSLHFSNAPHTHSHTLTRRDRMSRIGETKTDKHVWRVVF